MLVFVSFGQVFETELQLTLQLAFQNLSDTDLAPNGFTHCMRPYLLRLTNIFHVPCLGVVRRLGASKRASQLNTRGLKGSDLANIAWLYDGGCRSLAILARSDAAFADGSLFVDGFGQMSQKDFVLPSGGGYW